MADDLGWKALTGVSVRGSEHSHTGPIPAAARCANYTGSPSEGRKHDETDDRIALTPVPLAFYPAYLPANHRLTLLQPEIPQQPPRTVPKSNYLRVQPVEVDNPLLSLIALATNIGELTVRNLLAAATLCLGLAIPALASVELSSEQLDSATAGTTLILTFANPASIPAYAAEFTSQGWTVTQFTVTQPNDTLIATLGPFTPTITVNPFITF